MTASRFDAVLFDCDGVLVDSEPITNGVLREMLGELGWKLSVAECMRIFACTFDCPPSELIRLKYHRTATALIRGHKTAICTPVVADMSLHANYFRVVDFGSGEVERDDIVESLCKQK